MWSQPSWFVLMRILKFEFVYNVNNGDCDARSSMSFCLSTRINSLIGINQTKYLIRTMIMIITIITTKSKTRRWTPSPIIYSLRYVSVSVKKGFFSDIFMFHKADFLRMVWNF